MSVKWKIAQWLELRWWQRYLRHKDAAAYTQWKRGYWQGILQKAGLSTPEFAGKDILDAGCGPAGIYMILTQSRVTAADPLLQQYEEKLEVFNKEKYPHVHFVNTPLEKFASAQLFDFIFCMNAINHVQDMEAGIMVLRKHLKKDGRFIMTVDAHRYPFLKYVFRYIPGDALHPHQQDLEGYIRLLHEAGLEVVKTERIKEGSIFRHELLVMRHSQPV